jgi:hypothetical protein
VPRNRQDMKRQQSSPLFAKFWTSEYSELLREVLTLICGAHSTVKDICGDDNVVSSSKPAQAARPMRPFAPAREIYSAVSGQPSRAAPVAR